MTFIPRVLEAGEHNPYSDGKPNPTGITSEGSALLQQIQQGQVLSPKEAEEERRKYLKGFDQDNKNDARDQQSSNVAGAGNADGFEEQEKIEDEGFQILNPVSDKPLKEGSDTKAEKSRDPYAYPKDPDAPSENPKELEPDHWAPATGGQEPDLIRTDTANSDIEANRGNESLPEEMDWRNLRLQFIKFGIPTEDFPTPEDIQGSEASLIYDLTLRIVEDAATQGEYGSVSPEEDGRTYDVSLTPERISNPRVRDALLHKSEKLGADYLTNLWNEAIGVDITVDSDSGQSMITVRTKEQGRYLSMSTDDFSALLSVPLSEEKDALVRRVLMPKFNKNRHQNIYAAYKFFNRVTVNGKQIGALSLRNINVYLRSGTRV